ncbi:MAG: right-handed parallel beta-helix repeat-containing protein, partial [Spirochaetes bacterium]|nr:right-handed parallel beta-helix repeat-containing protein [Spirochaetota bacterium]
RLQKFIVTWDGEEYAQCTIGTVNTPPEVSSAFPEESNTNVIKSGGIYYARGGNDTSFRINWSQPMHTNYKPTVKYITADSAEYPIVETFYSNNIWIGTNAIVTNHDGTAIIYISGGSGTLAGEIIFMDDFTTDKGWAGYGGAGEWERGKATAGGGEYGSPDPAIDTSSDSSNYVLGNDIGGDYNDNLGATFWITSPVIDCTGYTNVYLNFYRFLGVEQPAWDHAYISVYNGIGWTQIWANTITIADSEWGYQSFNVSAYADNNANFRVRFGIGTSDGSWAYCGWNIDDLYVTGMSTTASAGPNQYPDPDTSQTFIIDTTPPNLTINQPESPTTITNIQIFGSTDPDMWVDVYNYTASNGSTVYSSNMNIQADSSGNFSLWLILRTPKATTNWITARSRDIVGNVSTLYAPWRKVRCINSGGGSGYVEPSTNKELGSYGDPNLKFIWTADAYMQNASFTIELPSKWSIPSLTSGDAGYIYISDSSGITFSSAPSNLQVNGNMVKVSFSNASVGGYVKLTYGTNNLTMVSNNAAIGDNQFVFSSTNNDPAFNSTWVLPNLVYPPLGKKQIITVIGKPLQVQYSNYMPAGVFKGETGVEVLRLDFTNRNLYANTKIERIILETENSNNINIVPNSAIASISLYTNGILFYQDSSIESSGYTVTLDFSATPLIIKASTLRQVLIKVNIANSATAGHFKLNFNSDSDIVAKDVVSDMPVDVDAYNGDSFPMRSSHCVIYENSKAVRVFTSFLGAGDKTAYVGEKNVLVQKLVFTSTNSNVNEVQITGIDLDVEDYLNSGIVPSTVIDKVTLQRSGGGPIYVQDSTIESAGNTIHLNLFASSLFISPVTSVTVDVKLDIDPATPVTNFHISVDESTNIKARDNVFFTGVTNYAFPGFSFAMRADDVDIVRSFKIHHDGSALLSAWERIIIEVLNTNTNPVRSFAGTITLDTTGDFNNISWTNNYTYFGSFTDGGAGTDKAYYTFASGDNGVITLSVRDDTEETIDIIASSPYITGVSNDLKIGGVSYLVHNISIGADYTTIMNGVAAASNNNILIVDQATFNEYVKLSPATTSATHLTILSAEWTNSGNNVNTIISGSSPSNMIKVSDGNSLVLMGFTINGGGQGIFLTNSSSSTLKYNIIKNSGYGLCLNNSPSGIIMSNAIYSNSLSGIYLTNDASDNNIMGMNYIYENGYGISMIDGDRNLISYNDIYLNDPNAGIRVSGTARSNMVFNNNIYSNTAYGYYGTGVSVNNNLIWSNRIYNNLNNAALYFQYVKNASVFRNLIYKNTGDGIQIDTATNSQVINNTIYNNSEDGIDIISGIANSVRNNIIFSNISDGIENSATASTDLYNNVFGNNGLDYNGIIAGIGDISADPVFGNMTTFSLQNTSPCINNGALPIPDNYFFCNVPDMGAVESLFCAYPVIQVVKSVTPLIARPYEVLTYTIVYSNISYNFSQNFIVDESLPTNVYVITNSSEISNQPHSGSAIVYYATNYTGTNWFNSDYDTMATRQYIRIIRWAVNSPVWAHQKGYLKFKVIIR